MNPLTSKIKENLELRVKWREEIKKFPQMDALGSADWWITKLLSSQLSLLREVQKWAELNKKTAYASDGGFQEDAISSALTTAKNKTLSDLQEFIGDAIKEAEKL